MHQLEVIIQNCQSLGRVRVYDITSLADRFIGKIDIGNPVFTMPVYRLLNDSSQYWFLGITEQAIAEQGERERRFLVSELKDHAACDNRLAGFEVHLANIDLDGTARFNISRLVDTGHATLKSYSAAGYTREYLTPHALTYDSCHWLLNGAAHGLLIARGTK